MILDNKSVSIDDLPKLNSEDFIPIESKFRTYLLLRNSLFFIIPFIGIIALHIFSVLADNIWLQYTLPNFQMLNTVFGDYSCCSKNKTCFINNIVIT